jgi:hypothetical protein
MSNVRTDQLPGGTFHVRPEHCPKTKQEKYKRLHFYVSKLGVALSDNLMEALLDLRRTAYRFPDPEVQQVALKAFNDEEYTNAVKELLCIWLHLEAMDQGGDHMPDWLLGFLRLAFGATDILIPHPRAMDVLNSYGHCNNEEMLCQEATVRASRSLGFGNSADVFAPQLIPVLLQTGQLRQAILKEALVLPLDSVISHSLT